MRFPSRRGTRLHEAGGDRGDVLLRPPRRVPRHRRCENGGHMMKARSFRPAGERSRHDTLRVCRTDGLTPVMGAPHPGGSPLTPDAGGRRPPLVASRETNALDRRRFEARDERGPTRSDNFSISVELGPERRSPAESVISERRTSQVPYGLREPRPVSFPERSPLSVPAVSDGKFMWRALNNSGSLRSRRNATGRTVCHHLPVAPDHEETFRVSEQVLFGGFPETDSGKNDGTNI